MRRYLPALLAGLLAASAVTWALGRPVPSRALQRAASVEPGVRVGAAEEPHQRTVSWDRPSDTVGQAVQLLDDSENLVATIPVGGDAESAVIEPPAGVVEVVVLARTADGGSARLGPVPVDAPSVASARASAGRSSVCLGPGYGIGGLAVAGYGGTSGYFGAYCTPPNGILGYCIDHGGNFPATPTSNRLAGNGTPLINQYGRVVPDADVAALASMLTRHGQTSDRITAAAVAIAVHALAGDWPALTAARVLDGRYTVSRDADAIRTRARNLLIEARSAAGPFALTVTIDGAPGAVGDHRIGRLRLVSRSGAGVAGVPINLAATGAAVPQGTTTGPDGVATFDLGPIAAAFSVTATVAADLPEGTVRVWSSGAGRQRVISAGTPTRPAATTAGTATPLGTVTLSKRSADADVATAGLGFRFEVHGGTADGPVVASVETDKLGATPTIDRLAAGRYVVAEAAHPAGFRTGGPWTFDLAAGESATWVVENAPVFGDLVVRKRSTNQAWQRPGAGVSFQVDGPADLGGSYPPAGALVTGPDGSTSALRVVPGRYRITEIAPPPGHDLAPPTEVEVTAADDHATVTVEIVDHAVSATLDVLKTDAVTGKPLSGAVFTVTTDGDHNPTTGPGGFEHDAGTITTGSNGTATVELPAGLVRLHESTPPPGFAQTGGDVTIELTSGQRASVTVTNRRRLTATFTKHPTGPTNPAISTLVGAVFTARTPAGGTLATCTTNPTGSCTLPGKPLLEGIAWCWTEDHAPDGYAAAEGGCLNAEAAIGGADATIVVDVAEQSNLIEVTLGKHDALSLRTPVAGARFALWACPTLAVSPSTNGCERLADATTDARGAATFPAQRPAKAWCITEEAAPAGWTKNPEPQCAADGGSAARFAVEQHRVEVPLTIRKVDAADPHTALPGATYRIWLVDHPGDIADGVLGVSAPRAPERPAPNLRWAADLTTGADGTAPVNVPQGFEWCLQEITPPAGYDRSSDVQCTDTPITTATSLTVEDHLAEVPVTPSNEGPTPTTPSKQVTTVPQLPRTGLGVAAYLAGGAIFLGLGVLLVTVGRRRARRKTVSGSVGA